METVNDTHYKIQLWDTAGQERYRTITSQYFKGVMGVVCVYACDNKESFENVTA